MTKTTYPRGAEWRQWDLHVHTPASIYQKYGSDDEATWNKYIDDLEALDNNFAVIGVNDYLFLDGYEKLIEKQKSNNCLQNLKFFPVLEFRVEKFAGVDFGSFKRINLHVIFSDEVSVETIKSQFLNTLEQSYNLENGGKWTRAITRESVAELGAEIKKGVPESQLVKYKSDLVEGFNNLNVDENQIYKSLEKDCFKGKYLIAIGKTEWADLKWSDSSIATKKSIINNADIVFTAADSPEVYLKSRQQLTKQLVNDLLLDCSDAHSFSNDLDKDRIGNCFTWIKADPTFDGLKHAIEEFDERIFIGEEPPLFDKVAKNRTKYISALKIMALPDYSDSENVWFDNIEIPLNHKLVAIIGNKGSGKSAIADVISLCANYHDDSDFSFLTSKKFREKKGKLAKNFEAHLTWESGVVSSKGLNDGPDEKALREVKYLPQGLFEKLTNEISTAENFQREIESVVFSHINEADKLNTTSFSALVELKTDSVAAKIQHLKEEMRKLNKNIILHEHKATDSYKRDLENSLAKKQEELNALAKPEEVINPSENPEKKQKHEQVNINLEAIREVIKKIEDEIKETTELKKVALIKQNRLEEVKSSLIQKSSELEVYTNELKQKLSDVDIEISSLFTYKINIVALDKEIIQVSLMLKRLGVLLDGDDSNPTQNSLHQQLEIKNNELKTEKGKLDKEQQEYQTYLTVLSDWVKERELLIGDSKTPNTINYYKSNLDYVVEPLKLDLERLHKERKELLKQIFNGKQEVVNVYKTARNKLNGIISDNADTLQNYRIEVDASLTMTSNFQDIFLSHTLQNKAGSFHSKDGAEKQFNQLVSGVEFDEFEGVTNFLDAVLNSFNIDLRVGQNLSKRVVVEQVRDIHGLYDYLFTLEFLTFNYQLKQGGKKIDQLSPGERGALLLVFYLLLDKNNIPLIIDQPEDNLDNHSVATILVPFIKAAKKKRQIIMVTHNPNLAVVSDAEQVIYVNLDKRNNYQFSVQSGSIENKKINEKIVEVLEGAMPAFNTRKRKYYD